MKSPFQDIIPSEKRSIRNISLSSKTKSSEEDETPITNEDPKPKRRKAERHEEISEEKVIFTRDQQFKGSGLSRLTLWLITIVSVAVLFLVITHFLNSATVTIETKKWQATLPAKLDLALQPSEGQVGYSVVTLADSVSDTLDATGEKEVSTKASGTLIVYNNFATSAQGLVAGTRFQSSKGLIYKIEKAVSIPGMKKVGGKDVPGSLEISVTAEKPGGEYNIGLDDFSVPGLAGTSKANKIYARSKTVMSGGNVGKIATVEDQTLAQKVEELKTKLNEKLKAKSQGELPGTQIIFNGLTNVQYNVQEPKLQDNKAVVEVKGEMKVYLIDTNSLAKILLAPQGVTVLPTDEFTLTIGDATAKFEEGATTPDKIDFSGNVTVEYKLDAEKFKSEIAGVSESEIPEISSNYKAISQISTNVKPFWKSTIPSNLSKIEVVVK
ncbi:MAG: hypothetical protein V4469_03870 [Patescibacteria group bacterium]